MAATIPLFDEFTPSGILRRNEVLSSHFLVYMLSSEIRCVSLHPKADFSMRLYKVYELQHDPFTIHTLKHHLEIHLFSIIRCNSIDGRAPARGKGRKVVFKI